MSEYFEVFEQAKVLLRFGPDDVDNLVGLAGCVDRHGAGVTERFYDALLSFPDTAGFLDGKVERLKATHSAWMHGLVAGDYGREYFDSRWRIGRVHVQIGLPPHWVECTMSLIRTGLLGAIAAEAPEPAQVARQAGSLIKICDLDLLVINLSYTEERLDRLAEFTGMKRALIENVIRLQGK